MKNNLLFWAISGLLLFSCTSQEEAEKTKALGIMTSFAEMVDAGVKPLALSEPMSQELAEELWPEAQQIANRYDVSIYRENELLKTALFPEDVAEDKAVFIFYKDSALQRYQDLKTATMDSISLARAFGRLLGYPDHKINALLGAQTPFRTTSDFGIQATNVFLYYKDLANAEAFYTEVLGLPLVADYTFAKTIQIAPDAFIILVDEKVGMHSSEEPKSVAIALLTDELQAWFDFLQSQDVSIKYPYRKRENNAHDGFVALDPEGYYLEFEEFKPHRENEKLMPLLQKDKALATSSDVAGIPASAFYGAVTWLYYDDMLEAQAFYEEHIGLKEVVDQGWAKIYAASSTGYIGLVDACRGMRDNTPVKGTTISFFLEDVESYFDYAKKYKPFPLRQDSLEVDEQGRYKAFVGYDPVNYYLEFDQFYDHPANQTLLRLLQSQHE